MAITFFIQSKKTPASIYVRIREYTIDAKARTNFNINLDDWDFKKGEPKTNYKKDEIKKNEANCLLENLNDLKKDLLNKLNNRKSNDVINTQWLKDIINPPPPQKNINSELPDGLINYFEKYIEFKKSENSITPSTIKKINVFKKMVVRYEKYLKEKKNSNNEIKIFEVDKNFQLNFEKYCELQKYSKNTIARAIRYIKTICIHARINDIETSNKLDFITSKFEKVNHIYLTPSEIKLIENCTLPNYLDNARDWLIISCFTGQRISDFMRFTKDMITEIENKLFIEFEQKKTKKIMIIPLFKNVISILNKRNGEFPKPISDQRYNEYIKEVCRIAGIDNLVEGSIKSKQSNRKINGKFEKYKLVTSHVGRRSYCSNFYNKIPTSLLTYNSGHTTEKMFLQYIGKRENTKAKELSKEYDKLDELF